MTISMDKQYAVTNTRDDQAVPRSAVVVSTSLPGDYPIGFYYENDPKGVIHRALANGFLSDSSMLRLIEAKPRVQCEVWLARHKSNGTLHSWIGRGAYTKDWELIARIPIDVEEGHGLEDQP